MAVSLSKEGSSLMGLTSRKHVVGGEMWLFFLLLPIRMLPFFPIISNAEVNNLVHKTVSGFCRRLDS